MDAEVLALPVKRGTAAAREIPAWTRSTLVMAALWAGLVMVVLAGIAIGPSRIAPIQIVSILAEQMGMSLPLEHTTQQTAILMNIRLPRVVLGLLVGAALGMGGAALQGLFRNPLADPGLLGISSGAALGAVTVIVLGTAWLGRFSLGMTGVLMPLAAFMGGLAATAAVYAISRRHGRVERGAMLLAGVAVNASAGSMTGLLVYLSDSEQLKSLTFWLMGSLGGADWSAVWAAAPLTLPPLLLLPRLARALNAMLLGDAVAGHLGFDPNRVSRLSVILVTASVGAAVAASGVIGFIGLVAPHLIRLIAGPDHRIVMPGAALAGAILLVGADIFARIVAAPADLPIGVVTGALGGPFFIWLLLHRAPHGRGTC
ncbi:iron ABC transporter permease [Magnetospirillum sp. SS-4]|uniref:FecCD family ABC transporter permease n=1 Tax=Magnetospirillum sp. SS-4 TaxID=2681465 RepID=UPI00137E435B|nr:iron ABC transporter permease [Magnetospirillum sp. SS-4]CAA7620103.1 vitamin B12 transporter subunit: membrane component of ABC superfamily [Magnetospirillum sp. SS-4]